MEGDAWGVSAVSMLGIECAVISSFFFQAEDGIRDRKGVALTSDV